MEIREILGLVVSIIIAILGVSAITITTSKKNNSKNIKQNVKNGDGNIQAGGNVQIDQKNGSD